MTTPPPPPPDRFPPRLGMSPPGHGVPPPPATVPPPGAFGPAGAPSAYGYGAAPVPQPASTDGKLMAAGIMSIVSGAVVGLFAVGMFVIGLVIDGEDNDFWGGDGWGALFFFIGAVMAVIAGVYLTAGIGCVRGRAWARVLSIVIESLAVGLVVLGMVNDGSAGGMIPLAWSGTILGLSIAGKPKR